MHTSKQVVLKDFEFYLQGNRASFEEIFSDFTPLDRIGIIARHSSGALEASTILMASIARFYDFYRNYLGNSPGKLRIYPDFYIFHIGKRNIEHYWFDIWPPYREVVVMDEPEQILEAINDRGISRLILPDSPTIDIKSFYSIPKENQFDSKTAAFLQETISSAEKRVKTCLVYSPNGRTKRSDILIKSNFESESNVQKCIRDSNGINDEVRRKLKKERQDLLLEGRVHETYRKTTLTEAISMLSTTTGLGEATLQSLSDMRRSKPWLLTI